MAKTNFASLFLRGHRKFRRPTLHGIIHVVVRNMQILAAKFPEHRVRGTGTWYVVRHSHKLWNVGDIQFRFVPLSCGTRSTF